MRRKYGDCIRTDGNCTVCHLMESGLDCHKRPMSKLELARVSAGLEKTQLSELSGVNMRQIQRVESGDSEAGNLTAKNLLAIADALGVDPHNLI